MKIALYIIGFVVFEIGVAFFTITALKNAGRHLIDEDHKSDCHK